MTEDGVKKLINKAKPVKPQHNDIVFQVAKLKRHMEKSQTGFTLVEVLVSLVILSIGLLGIFAMQSRALMDNQDAYLRTQAIFLAYDMGDRIRANAGYWKKTTTDIATVMATATGMTSTNHPFCSTLDPIANNKLATLPNTCSIQEMAEYDAYRWMADVKTILPSATTTMSRKPDNNTTSASNDIIQINITWARANQTAQNTLGSNAAYSLDVRL